MVVVLERVYLLGGKTSVSEHANLTSNVAPVVSAAVVFEFLHEASSHFLHAARHVQQVLVPRGSKLGVTEDYVNDSCTMNRRVRVHGSGNTFDARLDFACFSAVSGEERDTTSSFTIETEVFGKGLE